jgi:hypothetical protein
MGLKADVVRWKFYAEALLCMKRRDRHKDTAQASTQAKSYGHVGT